MQQFIERQHTFKESGKPFKSQNKIYPQKHQCEGGTSYPLALNKDFKLTNHELQKLAQKHEAYKNNNNIFAGKNIADNTNITSFYTLKSQPFYQTPLTYFGAEQQKNNNVAKSQTVNENSIVKDLFTNNVATNQCDRCKPKDFIHKGISNLVQEPRLNPNYDDAWFLQKNPQYWNNLRTIGSLKSNQDIEDDPIMKLNPTLYKIVETASVREDKKNFTDPFQKIMEQQNQWIENGQKHSYVKDLIYRTDIDHPYSIHNQTTGQTNKISVNFPNASEQNYHTKIAMNSFYNKDALCLKNQFDQPRNPQLVSLDNRDTGKFNNDHQNKLYKPNTQLLEEIDRSQKIREYQRNQRQLGLNQEIQQIVEEISPNGAKRQIVAINQQSNTKDSPGQVHNPFQEEQYEDESVQIAPKTMFSVKMDNGSNINSIDEERNFQNQMDENCRKELPNRQQNYYPSQDQIRNTMSFNQQDPRPETSNFQQINYNNEDYVISTENDHSAKNTHTKSKGSRNQSSKSPARPAYYNENKSSVRPSKSPFKEETNPFVQTESRGYSNSRTPHTNKTNSMKQEASTLKKKKQNERSSNNKNERSQIDGNGEEESYYQEGESDYEDDGEEFDQQYRFNKRESQKVQFRDQQSSVNQDNYMESDEQMNEQEDDESLQESDLKNQKNRQLEQRLEQIKQNIQNQRQENYALNQTASSKYNKNQQSIEQLESILRKQREKLDDLQNSNPRVKNQINSQKKNAAYQQKNISPLRKKNEIVGSSSNLEKAYEELEREIMDIKEKLQNSISLNESQNAKAGSYLIDRRDGQNGKSKAYQSYSKYGNNNQFKASASQKSRKGQAQSVKSASKKSRAADSRSPDETGTYGRNGEQNLDDPDYSLSVSELNSNMGNSLLKSAARGIMDYQAQNGYKGPLFREEQPLFNE